MFEYDKESQKAAENLDKYDLTEELEKLCQERVEIYDARKSLSQISIEVERALEDLTEDELLDYLKERYNVHYSEEISYYIY